MKKVTTEIDTNLSTNSDNEFYSEDDSKLFSDAPDPVEQPKEEVVEHNSNGKIEVNVSIDEDLRKLSFWSYMKSMHSHPIKTLQEGVFPKLTFGIYHMLIGAFVIGLAVTINAAFKVGVPSWETIPSSIVLCAIVALVPFGVSLFNNFFISSFIFIFAKTLSVHYDNGDYQKMLGYLFPATALISSPLTLIMMLNIDWSGIEMQFAIASSIFSIIPAIISYSALKSIGKKSTLVYIVLAFWVVVCYFVMKYAF
ncbi:TPA: hypothetical protein RI821_002835 [Vibrio cholerae]|uniref:YIP1 family protein n=1 Tax=Vibrio cholerae TaxID=666 RepID=A0A5Q6PJX0_VIBCL|nr:hypothetical protein [Vibrio cholerae]KAA1255144.1 hypothetical protein F0M16_07960 [Vibrio cholerae]HDV5624275.1 hypothetical protein [Vibrio cholerae]